MLVAFFIYRSRAQDSTTAADELRRRFGGESFDFILDDGDHNAAAVERSFKRLFFGTMVYLCLLVVCNLSMFDRNCRMLVGVMLSSH